MPFASTFSGFSTAALFAKHARGQQPTWLGDMKAAHGITSMLSAAFHFLRF
jgi:hypothetical protein